MKKDRRVEIASGMTTSALDINRGCVGPKSMSGSQHHRGPSHILGDIMITELLFPVANQLNWGKSTRQTSEAPSMMLHTTPLASCLQTVMFTGNLRLSTRWFNFKTMRTGTQRMFVPIPMGRNRSTMQLPCPVLASRRFRLIYLLC